MLLDESMEASFQSSDVCLHVDFKSVISPSPDFHWMQLAEVENFIMVL
jgi:hypothetical protein